MVNIDGVKYGNSRCNLSGIDINRVWRKPSDVLFPEVTAIKTMIEGFKSERKVVMMCDLHGHSMARNAFAYCNDYATNQFQAKLFPYILEQLDTETFSFAKSTFKV